MFDNTQSFPCSTYIPPVVDLLSNSFDWDTNPLLHCTYFWCYVVVLRSAAKTRVGHKSRQYRFHISGLQVNLMQYILKIVLTWTKCGFPVTGDPWVRYIMAVIWIGSPLSEWSFNFFFPKKSIEAKAFNVGKAAPQVYLLSKALYTTWKTLSDLIGNDNGWSCWLYVWCIQLLLQWQIVTTWIIICSNKLKSTLMMLIWIQHLTKLIRP